MRCDPHASRTSDRPGQARSDQRVLLPGPALPGCLLTRSAAGIVADGGGGTGGALPLCSPSRINSALALIAGYHFSSQPEAYWRWAGAGLTLMAAAIWLFAGGAMKLAQVTIAACTGTLSAQLAAAPSRPSYS